MLLTVEEFRGRVRNSIDELVADLQSETSRMGAEEAKAWRESLPQLVRVLDPQPMQQMHLYFGGNGNLAVEYQLPASGCFADAVLLGSCEGTPSAVIIELKHWITRTDKPGAAEGLIERRGTQELHPSEQVKGYVEYCRHFHSAVQEKGAAVHGCVLFTRDMVVQPYIQAPNDALAENYPVFNCSQEHIARILPDYLRSRLTSADPVWAKEFSDGRYRQTRGFVQQIAKQVQTTKTRAFELLDNQRRALALCKAIVEETIQRWKHGKLRKKVVVIVGPPGSGKSAVAAKLWAEISMMAEVPKGDIVFTTTSMSQSSNWLEIFGSLGVDGARGVIRKASTFHPITTGRVGKLRKARGESFLAGTAEWRSNLEALRSAGEIARSGAEDDSTLICLVDEAHSLINTERDGGVGQFGFAPSLGPQAYHIMRVSTLTVLFLDPEQGFRHRENTTLDDLKAWAKELGAGELEVVSLEGAQFRCGGSTEYVDWVGTILSGASIERNKVLASAWFFPSTVDANREEARDARNSNGILRVAETRADYRRSGNVVVLNARTRRSPFEFKVVDDPFSMESLLRERIAAGNTARLLSSYSRTWKTRGVTNPHLLPPSEQDFHESMSVDGQTRVWSRVWNVVPVGTDDYSYFVQAKLGGQIAVDPLSEVGCPYAVRGFDYDYVGLMWLEDMVWRDGRWHLNPEFMHESALSQLLRRSKAEHGEGASTVELTKKVAQAYRILMTRALKGMYLWIKDAETREYIVSSLL